MVTPKAIADGSATSIAANPPQTSPPIRDEDFIVVSCDMNRPVLSSRVVGDRIGIYVHFLTINNTYFEFCGESRDRR